MKLQNWELFILVFMVRMLCFVYVRKYEAFVVWWTIGDCGIHGPPMKTCHVDE